MLQSLSIRNFTLIESLDLTFSRGLNIITGETGAGKSIIVDALLLLFGERGSAEYVRKGTQKAIIEGTFLIRGNDAVPTFLQDHEFDVDGDNLILRREVSDKGTSRSFINDTPATLAITRELGTLLVDFHGQHEHQSLLKAEAHVNFLDNFEGLHDVLRQYHECFGRLKRAIHTLSELKTREQSLHEQAEFRRFQLQELEQVQPQRDEEKTLEEELAIRENSEQLYDLSHQLSTLLYDSDDSVRDRLAAARKVINELAAIDKQFAEYKTELQSAIVTVEEIAKFTQSYRDDIEFDPARLEEIRYRLQQLSRLRRKYGSMEELFRKWDELRREQSLTDNFDEEIQRVAAEIAEQRCVLGTIGEDLSRKRQTVARRVEAVIVASLQNLGMPHIRFAVRFDRFRQPTATATELVAQVGEEFFAAFPNGLDEVEFLIAANPGEELKPLAKIASGGEISRVMLALKQALAESDKLPMMVFDEIDTGISGRIAQKVGKTMKELARQPQILSITHQPQIAAFADAHILVEKRQTATETRISARVLTHDEHIREVARLLSGEEITDAALQSARELAEGK